MGNFAVETLEEGSKLLQPLFSMHRFVFVPLESGSSSGGHFASAEFKRGDRRVVFHFRDSLGMVSYHLGSHSMTHEEYMLSVMGKPYASRYPGFCDNPMDSFRRLAEDIDTHCVEFLEGTDEALLRRIEHARFQWSNRAKLPE